MIAPRLVEAAHVPITAGMTNAQISVAKYTNDRHLIWHEARTSLKNDIIRSLGPTLSSTIGPPPMGFTTITVPHIVAAVKGFYGTVDQRPSTKWRIFWLVRWIALETWTNTWSTCANTCSCRQPQAI